jgi:HD-GYP domain-containing protein (c-di-GMP phosphodiesterase class II)
VTSERAYRPALPMPQAIELLRCELALGRWDPRVFAALEEEVAAGAWAAPPRPAR